MPGGQAWCQLTLPAPVKNGKPQREAQAQMEGEQVQNWCHQGTMQKGSCGHSCKQLNNSSPGVRSRLQSEQGSEVHM